MEKMTKVQKVKAHIKRNKDKYITGGVCLAVGATVGVVCSDGIKSKVSSINVILGKDNTINNITIITQQLVRRGHAGNIIKCVETGEIFASQNRAAEALDLKPSKISEFLKGKRDHVNGYTFEKIGDFNSQE